MRLSLNSTYFKMDPSNAASTDDEVHYLYTITNNGLLTLYDIGIKVKALVEHDVGINCVDTDGELVEPAAAGVVKGLASFPDMGLAPASFITCTATDGVSRSEVRRVEARRGISTQLPCEQGALWTVADAIALN